MWWNKKEKKSPYREIDWDKVDSTDAIKSLLKLKMYAVDITNERVKDDVKKLLKKESN